jgi:hypothetical protein
MQAQQQQALNPGAEVSYSITTPQYQEPPAEALSILNQIMQTDPYAGVHGAYEQVARQMAEAFQSRGSQAARTQQQAALSTGLTPLEASGAGENALLENMRSYYAQLPQLRLAQSMLPAQRQEQLSGLLAAIAQLYSIPGGQQTMQYSLQPLQQAQAQGQQQTMGQNAALQWLMNAYGQQGPAYSQLYPQYQYQGTQQSPNAIGSLISPQYGPLGGKGPVQQELPKTLGEPTQLSTSAGQPQQGGITPEQLIEQLLARIQERQAATAAGGQATGQTITPEAFATLEQGYPGIKRGV